MRKIQSGQTLAASLVVIAIIAVLAVVMMKGSGAFSSQGSPRADGRGTTVPGLVKAKAEDTVCKNYLGQLRLSLQMSHDTGSDEVWPQTLEETRLGSQFYSCPMGKGKEPYSYDAQTGRVKCVHPGHGKY
ncbi:MAG: prepilin-type N-terminal cleavage/methylation domain-containing protein [Chlorobia bacterium]|nr:prepilin-type N-terminal cleavage/methylation domain-containing protein [Fimbriimonadaceae bacterium]